MMLTKSIKYRLTLKQLVDWIKFHEIDHEVEYELEVFQVASSLRRVAIRVAPSLGGLDDAVLASEFYSKESTQ